MAMTAGPSDVPAPCQRCGATTLHRQGVDGQWHCMQCLMRGMQPMYPAVQPPPAQPQMTDVRLRSPTIGDQFRNAIVIMVVWAQACSGHH